MLFTDECRSARKRFYAGGKQLSSKNEFKIKISTVCKYLITEEILNLTSPDSKLFEVRINGYYISKYFFLTLLFNQIC